MLLKKDDNDAVEIVDDLLPTRRKKLAPFHTPKDRKIKIWGLLSELTLLEPPGIPEIKQVEMYTKWRKLIAPYAQDITCSRPSEEIMKKVRDEKNKKSKKKKKKKKKKSNKKTTEIKKEPEELETKRQKIDHTNKNI